MKRKISKYQITTVSISISSHTISEMSFTDPHPHPADFELAQLQEKLRETELVMENIVSNTHHSPDRWVDIFSDVTTRLRPLLTGGCCEMEGFSLSGLPLFQGEGRDGRSGGESPAAADGDHSGDAGAPPGGGGSSREEELGG